MSANRDQLLRELAIARSGGSSVDFQTIASSLQSLDSDNATESQQQAITAAVEQLNQKLDLLNTAIANLNLANSSLGNKRIVPYLNCATTSGSIPDGAVFGNFSIYPDVTGTILGEDIKSPEQRNVAFPLHYGGYTEMPYTIQSGTIIVTYGLLADPQSTT